MKALVVSAAFAALSSNALAGAALEARPQAGVEHATATVIADAGRLGPTSLTTLNGPSHWLPAERETARSDGFSLPDAELDGGTLVLACGLLALVLGGPIGRMLRRQEQQRRATALASAIAHTPRN